MEEVLIYEEWASIEKREKAENAHGDVDCNGVNASVEGTRCKRSFVA